MLGLRKLIFINKTIAMENQNNKPLSTQELKARWDKLTPEQQKKAMVDLETRKAGKALADKYKTKNSQ